MAHLACFSGGVILNSGQFLIGVNSILLADETHWLTRYPLGILTLDGAIAENL